MRYQPLWQQNASYPAGVDRVLINTLWPASTTTGGAASTQANTLNVSIAPGTVAVALTSGNNSALCRWDAAEVVALGSVPAASNSRIDLIVAQVRDAAIDAGANNDFLFQVIAGTATTGTPAPPAVPVNAAAICQVLVPGGGANNLNAATITDRRTQMFPRDSLISVMARAAAFTFPATFASMPWDTVVSDNAAMWNAGQVGFVVPAAGIYQVTFGINVAVVASNNYSAAIYQGGAAVRSFGYFSPTVTAALPVQMTAALKCTAGQLIQTAMQVLGGRGDISPGVANNWASVTYLGTG